jgi:hypothetical protein
VSTEVQKEIGLEIGHVLFIDIVGYSKLLIDEQRDYLHTLNEVVRRTDSFRTADAAGKLTRLPTGDGMAVVFATTPDPQFRARSRLAMRCEATRNCGCAWESTVDQ